jgi:chromosome segregation protein
MRLKSLEIRGFKSFADKTDLNFKNGVTAVVGPNGSGKSNISDAVRWVLGEQSVKSLRGGKMEDVIFAGTQFRKPVGLAQVALTLDNSDNELSIDYSDVTVSRRLYRSGESEYYINNTQCRLKDIQELFMDTGIGKEGYSIIGQGKIDAILSGRAEDRRMLLEEAAGIVKFKSRKEEAEKKLDNVEQNLVRINDILGTYEERLEPLRIENEKAKEFVKLSEVLKRSEIALILQFIEKFSQKLESQKNELSRLQKDIEALFSDKERYKNELNHWQQEFEKQESQHSAEKDKYHELKNMFQSINSEINLLNERVENLTSYIQKAEKDLSGIDSKVKGLKTSKGSLEEEYKELQINQNGLKNNIISYEGIIEGLNRNIRNAENSRNNLREEALKLMRKVSENRNAITLMENNIEAAENKIQSMEQSKESFSTSIKINTSTKIALDVEIKNINELIVKQEEEIRIIKRNITKYNSELNNNEQILKQLNATVNKLDANYNMLINLEKQYEGYAKAVKSLMQHIDNRRIPEAVNNCFVLGEIINVPNKLETAIEIALGGAISDVITKDEGIAKRLIGYLKENSLGRATFLPLNILQYKQLSLGDNIKQARGFVGIASELIEYNLMFAPAVKYVLGRTVIADNMDNALTIAKMSSYSYRIVTLSGEVINPGGSLTGGSIYHKSANIIGRKREIEEIEGKLKEIKAEIDLRSKQVQVTRETIKELDNKGLNLKDEIHYKHIEITKLEGKINAINEESEKLRTSFRTAGDEITVLKSNEDKNKQELLQKEKEVEAMIAKEKNNEDAIEKSEAEIKSYLKELEEIKDRHTELKIKKAHADEIITSKVKELERISKDLDYSIEKKLEYEKDIDNWQKALESNKEAIIEANRNIRSMQCDIEALEAKFQANEFTRIELKEKIKKVDEKYEEVAMLLMRKEDEKHKFEIVFAKQESEKEAMLLRLNEEFELTFAEALKYRLENINVDKLRSDISSLKSKISALGVVNLGSIEEYEQTKEKFSFMSEQKEDLTKAKAELVNVINEMTNKMKEVFNLNFKKLKEYFNETFKELFKGGSADLILSEGDELTAAIDINVQPPGKKLQNINLMSGGEKVLSAIALLFAILKMKPTPFCILDEIEAALDDANVFRYAEFLKKFSSNIQFIVITHRKGTMEASDVLYGVTMEEKGVSKIVSVDLGKV